MSNRHDSWKPFLNWALRAKMAAFESHTFVGSFNSDEDECNAKVLQTKLAFCLGLTIDEWLWRNHILIKFVFSPVQKYLSLKLCSRPALKSL